MSLEFTFESSIYGLDGIARVLTVTAESEAEGFFDVAVWDEGSQVNWAALPAIDQKYINEKLEEMSLYECVYNLNRSSLKELVDSMGAACAEIDELNRQNGWN
jgi:hypothetical protein